MSSSSTAVSAPDGPASVSGAPNLPAGFTDTFSSQFIDAADDVQTFVLPGAGHWVAEQAPDEMLAALTSFLGPYRDGSKPE